MKIKKLICSLLCGISISVFANPNTTNKVIITGIVENSDSQQNVVGISINRFSLKQIQKGFKIDELGQFKCEFNVSTPTDLWFSYQTNFLIAVHPGDSIHVILDGSKKDRPSLLKSIKFSGTAGVLNQEIAFLQQLYYDSPLYTYTDETKKQREIEIIKSSSSDEYRKYISMQKEDIYNNFIKISTPCIEAKLWSEFFLNTAVLQKTFQYPQLHNKYNNMNAVEPSLDYYDIILNVLPLTDSMFICGSSISDYINLYHYFYARPHLYNDVKGKKLPYTTNNPTDKDLADSLNVYGIIKYTPDTLLRQMVLTEFFLQKLNHADISVYEKYIDIVQEYIKLPFLSKPLSNYYEKTKKSVINPSFASEQILIKSSNSTISGIIDSILIKHKNKVIYIDCWATWCGPCLSEMPNSKILMDEMNGKDVAFVYLCIDSNEKEWKALVDKHQLKGEHYLLSKTQSDDFRRIYEIGGIPHYIIIDKKGTVLGKDYNLRPNNAKSAIEKLLTK